MVGPAHCRIATAPVGGRYRLRPGSAHTPRCPGQGISIIIMFAERFFIGDILLYKYGIVNRYPYISYVNNMN